MGYREFLTGLFEDGRVTVPEVAPLLDEEVRAGDDVIAEYERVYRVEMPGTPLQFSAAAARWAGTRFFRACQFAVYRDVGEEAINEELGIPYGEPVSPNIHYSVDLVFRYLPDITKFAGSAAEQDPLLDHLYGWARQWPLSSVGMSEIDKVEIDCFADDASLLRLYVDRVIATRDETRLSHDRVRQMVQGSLGLFPELAQEIASTLSEYDVQDTKQ